MNNLWKIINPRRLEPDQVQTKALREAKPLMNKTEPRSFLEFCNVNRQLKNFTEIVYLLSALIMEGDPDQLRPLSDDQLAALKKPTYVVCFPPMLTIPRPDSPYSVDTSARQYGRVTENTGRERL